MADTKITDLATLTGANLATGDEFPFVDISDTTMAASGTDKSITGDELAKGMATTLGVVGRDKLWTAKGDLAAGTAANAAAALTVGTFGQAPLADSTPTTGLIYGQPDPLMSKYLKPQSGLSYETYPRAIGTQNQGPLVSGTVSLFAVALPKNFVVHNISFTSNTTAATATHYWFSLCNSSYVTLRSTADQLTGAWAANTEKRVALSSNFTTTYEGLYYLAIMVAGTVPSLAGTMASTNAVVNTIAPILWVNGITSQTTAPADGTNLATSPTAKTTGIWAYCD